MYSHRKLSPTFTTFFVQGVFKRQKEQGYKGRPDDVSYVRKNFQYQAAAGIEAMGAGYMAVCGKCMKRATQMFYSKALKDISRAVVEAPVRY